MPSAVASTSNELTPDGGATTLIEAWGTVRRRLWIIAVCMTVGGAGAFFLSRAEQKRYTTTASLVFTGSSAAQQASGVAATAPIDPTGQRNTNLALVQLARAVPQAVASQLRFGISAGDVRRAVSVSASGQSNIVSITATWTSPALAQKMANNFASAFISEQRDKDRATVQQGINLVREQYDALSPTQRGTPQGQSLLDHLESLQILRALQSSVSLASAAARPTQPSSPKTPRNTVIGALLGLLIGIVAAFTVDRLDRRLREPSAIEESFGRPLLGVIPHGRGRRPGDPRLTESFRMLRAHLRYFNVDRDLKVLLVVSGQAGEGKTTVAAGIAATGAAMGARTLVVEADLRKPTMNEAFELAPHVGLSETLVSAVSAERAVQPGASEVEHDGRTVDVLVAGQIPPNPTELLESFAMQDLLMWARANYDFVVIDTPPLSLVADAIPLFELVDGVIAVCRLDTTTRDETETLSRRLTALDAPVLGVVVNDSRLRSGSSYYGYRYTSNGSRDRVKQ